MNIRPRCREWLPLCTQQLRLRNLQAIQGVNIELNVDCSTLSADCSYTHMLYFTLHDHPKNHQFYQSEKLTLRKHLSLKWAEIKCPEILKSNANCVCIKIWAYTEKKTETFEITRDVKENAGERDNALIRTKKFEEPKSALMCPIDTLLFKWAVYFSGLMPLSQNSDVKCCANSLIFQMNNEYFASPEHFSTECLRGQLALNYERYSASVPKYSIPTPDEFAINSPQVSRSASPVVVDWQKDLLRLSKTRYIQLNCIRSEVRTSYDLMKLLKLQKLQRQRLQTQRESVDISADIKRLSLRCITKEEVLRKGRTTSINSSTSSSVPTASHYHSMGRTLSILLAEQQHADPHQLLQAQQLQEQIESLKSKQRLLVSAQETFKKRITFLKEQLDDAVKSTQVLNAWLTQRGCKLHEEHLELQRSLVQQLERRQHKRSVTQHVERIMFSLCLELKGIYPIARNRYGIYTICGVPFPTTASYVLESFSAQSAHISENITPMALSASMGYIAHLIEMISVVLNRPLRNPIIHEGSRTRIIDIVNDIPSYASREFPLYSRSLIPTKAVKCAVNLLNQNIAQLCFDFTGACSDTRATIENLLSIFKAFVQIEQDTLKKLKNSQTLSGKDLLTTDENNCNEVDGSQRCQHPYKHHNYNHNHQEDNDNCHQLSFPSYMSPKNSEQDYSLSMSHSSVDINNTATTNHCIHRNVPVFSLTTDSLLHTSEISSHAISIQDRSVLITASQQRNCRSLGSYTDSEEEVFHSTSIKCFSNSESMLTSLQSGGSGHI